MKQFATILNFELKSYLKNKVFVGVTIVVVLLLAAVMFFPRITALGGGSEEAAQEGSYSSGADSTTSEIAADRPAMLIKADTQENAALVQKAFAAAFPGYQVQTTADQLAQVKEQITAGEAECAFVLDSLTSYTYYVNNLSMYDSNTSAADSVLKNIYQINAMEEMGIAADDAAQILAVGIQHDVLSLGKDQMQNFFYTYIMIFALYMVILLYGQMVATNIATEKSSRAMELLVTSARPVSMMFGKVIASCLAGLLQLLAVFGSAYLFYNINKSLWADNAIIASIFDMPLSLLFYMLLFFMLGFFIYAFMYGAIGSTASKVEDINTLVMPLTIVFIIAFLVVAFSMSSGSVDNVVMLICSYFPLTSPMAMFTRIAMSTVPFYEIAISIAILVASVVGVGVLSAKIYRVGVLLYGTTPKFGAIIKAVRKA